MTALDEVRKDIWHDVYSEYKQVKKETPRGKGRPKKSDPEAVVVKAAKAKADEIKGSAYALGKAPEHLTERQQFRLDLIASQNPRRSRTKALAVEGKPQQDTCIEGAVSEDQTPQDAYLKYNPLRYE